MSQGQKINRLSTSNSPYLLQHAFNPVDWQEWGAEALQAAREQNRLIFLSIGYSTCHWCHVMERESFENEEAATLINAEFVAIKVDREQRPDLDQVYMDVCQALTGSGGWPLTLVLTPDQEPVFAGTYFPLRARHGRPGLLEILATLAATWKTSPDKLIEGARKVSSYFRKKRSTAARFPEKVLVDNAVAAIAADYDARFGGFTAAPKFPMGHVLELLLTQAYSESDMNLLAMVEHTLQAMYKGGLFDHTGGGFCRYSTDERWLVPHFEKMLYDNALLLRVYAEAFKITGKKLYREVAGRVCDYLLRDLRSKNGGFFSAEDADSEGHEGKFYVFSYAEFLQLAGKDKGERFAQYFGITPEGNFEGDTGILHLRWLPEEFCKLNNLCLSSFIAELNDFLAELADYRARRIRPLLDDKVITSWNGLVIGALARAGRIFARADLIEAAQQAAGFIKKHLCLPDGSLQRCWRNGKAEFSGFFEDYAFLTSGLLELYRSDYQPVWLEWAYKLQQIATGLFAGREPGSYFETAANAEKLLFRPQNSFDGAIPSARSVFADNCVILAAVTGRNDFSEMATAIFADSADLLHRAPNATTAMAGAMRRFYDFPVRFLIDADSLADAEQFLGEIEAQNLPGAVVLVCINEAEKLIYNRLLEDAGIFSSSRRPVVYICNKDGCRPPVFSMAELKKTLAALNQ